jgi:hypothetical protein
MKAHICQGGTLIKGFIRKYPAVLCSMCKDPSEAIDVEMNEEDIDEHNRKLATGKSDKLPK